MEVDESAATAPSPAALVSTRAGAVPAGGDDDDDDDWDPKVGSGVVLRPHVLQWLGSGAVPAPAPVLRADPLHDPEADGEDQRWVAEQLLVPDAGGQRSTAAVLSCPGCFTPVCYQCQQHERYARQWRAAEVRNCDVDRCQALSMPGGDPGEKFFAVRCSACGAEVGLQDDEGVYHLFQVLESPA